MVNCRNTNYFLGCTGISYYYDENGNNTNIWYWGKDDKIAERKDTGIAQEYMVHNDYGHVIRKRSPCNPKEVLIILTQTTFYHKELFLA